MSLYNMAILPRRFKGILSKVQESVYSFPVCEKIWREKCRRNYLQNKCSCFGLLPLPPVQKRKLYTDYIQLLSCMEVIFWFSLNLPYEIMVTDPEVSHPVKPCLESYPKWFYLWFLCSLKCVPLGSEAHLVPRMSCNYIKSGLLQIQDSSLEQLELAISWWFRYAHLPPPRIVNLKCKKMEL